MSHRNNNVVVRRKSDLASSWWRANHHHQQRHYNAGSAASVTIAELPWGALKVVQTGFLDYGMLPAKFAAQSLMLEMFMLFERRLVYISTEEPIDKPLNRTLRRGEDPYFENLLHALQGVCETCLPCVLSSLIRWHEEQQKISLSESGETKDRSMKKTLGSSYLFCVVLIEILPQLHYHPTDCEQHITFLVSQAFNQISFRDPTIFGANYSNSLVVAETFAEVIGVLSQSHPKLIQKSFTSILTPLRSENPMSSNTARSIISLLMGMKYFRIKTNQVADFEMGIKFLDELATYYLEVDLKQKDLKHALAGLLVELLTPVAALTKTEAYNIPDLIAFVDKLYGPTYDLVNKKQHKMAAYPLLTCLLSISQSKFFLSSWVQFLNLTLANLKNKDVKVSRIALESLQRLLWVYIIRNSCEGNTATRSRLESICSSLFPRGNRYVVPRDAPLGIFVRIIEFIAQQKLDFAFKEIIFDLLGCNRTSSRTISVYPERMNIGIRALMVIADDFQQREGPPAMPRSLAPPASGTIMRVKRTYSTKPLTSERHPSLRHPIHPPTRTPSLSKSTTMPFECFACGSSYSTRNLLPCHWNGENGCRKCEKFDSLFDKVTLATKEWALLDDKTAKPIPIKDWQDLFGEGPYRLYIYVDERTGRVTRVGQTKETVAQRLTRHDKPPLPTERVYEVASGLSKTAATNLEAFLLQCHNLRAPTCRMRNDHYGWPVEVPADKSSAQMRAMAVLVLKPTMLAIKSGRAVPIEKPQSARQKSRTPHKVTSTEAFIEGLPRKSDSQFERLSRAMKEEEARRREAEPSSAKSVTTKRRRDGGAEEGTPAAKRR